MWTRVWARELDLLKDMGFSDSAQLLPVLQQHIGIPTSLCPERQGQPSAEGMQRVVAHLLGASGVLPAATTPVPAAVATPAATPAATDAGAGAAGGGGAATA